MIALQLPSKVVLGKRKAAPTTFRVAYVKDVSTSEDEDDTNPSSSDYSTDSVSEADSGSEEDDLLAGASSLRVQGGQNPLRDSPKDTTRQNVTKEVSKAPSQRKKCYNCSWEGCDKRYTKPARLAEHERSHTGERPFKCTSCDKSYLRETHLAAHLRTHRSDNERSFACSYEGCSKRFWTGQHVRRHEEAHSGDKPFSCTHDGCPQAFSKNHQLRKHVATDHFVLGTKPYICSHQGCPKSFTTAQKLSIHSKVHESNRYVCSLVHCTSGPSVVFQTWSALQAHIREAHPPTCPYPECNGRTFTAQKGLRGHLKVHQDREHEQEAEMALTDHSEVGNARKRRRGGEIARDWICDHDGCGKSFKSKKALITHGNVTHLGLRPFTCDFSDCGQTFGYKHVLQRHLARHRASLHHILEEDVVKPPIVVPSAIELLTGMLGDRSGPEHPPPQKRIRCPWPDLFSEPRDSSRSALCTEQFGRAYDLKRHMKAAHAFDVEMRVLTNWLEGRGM